MNVIELHMIQSVPSSNINRGEDGDCKTAIFGGCERQRVSSQAWKRPIREIIQHNAIKNGDPSGLISKVFGNQIIDELVNKGETRSEVCKYLKALKIGFTEISDDDKSTDDKKNTLMYLSSEEIRTIINAFDDYKSNGKVDSKSPLKPILTDSQSRIAADIALFGRMFASDSSLNVYGAVKMSHALSTHSIEIEDDYFTAVDQLNPNGAGHLGNSAYTSSTMYRYIAIDVDQLKTNLGPDGDVNAVIKEFIKAAVVAFPKGKENVMAAYSRPSYINAIVKDGQPFTFANAFETPVKSGVDGYEPRSRKAMEEFSVNAYNKGWDDIKLNIEIASASDIDTVIEALEK